MHTTLRRAKRFEDLLDLPENDTPYAFETMFSSDGFLARRLAKKKLKLLRRIDDKLRGMLEDGERVRFLTSGSNISFWESYFLGWMAYYLSRRAIVLTDRRILLLQIDSRRRPKELVAQIRYSSIQRIKRTGLGSILFFLNDGGRRVFAGVPRADRKFLRSLGEMIGSGGGERGLEELCPHCYVVVQGRPARCAACGGPFKSARRAALLSLLFPGLGDVYLGHWKFAAAEILVASVVWLAVLLPDPQYPLTGGELMVLAGIVALIMHVPDALATRYIARKGIYPARGGATGQDDVRRVGADSEWAARD